MIRYRCNVAMIGEVAGVLLGFGESAIFKLGLPAQEPLVEDDV